MKNLTKLKVSLISVLFIAMAIPTATIAGEVAKTVVFVHGAFADGSSWNKVMPLLQANGLKTISVQNPLTSLADDVAFTRRALEQAEPPVVLVGHSWAGMVITEAGNDKKVKSLVYISALAPSVGESVHDIFKDEKKVPGLANPIVDKSGFMSLSEDAIVKYFAPDIPKADAKLIASSQGKLATKSLDEKVTIAAWKNKPNWFVVSLNDKMIHPDVLRKAAEKIKATTVSLATSHVSMLSKPKLVAKVILEAAGVNKD
jgi:pimeloyl-ACP methyl ester carboxylesterase